MPVLPNYTTPFRCGNCGTDQRFYSGDPEDITAIDVDAVECYKCGAVEIIFPEYEWVKEQPYVEKGFQA